MNRLVVLLGECMHMYFFMYIIPGNFILNETLFQIVTFKKMMINKELNEWFYESRQNFCKTSKSAINFNLTMEMGIQQFITL